MNTDEIIQAYQLVHTNYYAGDGLANPVPYRNVLIAENVTSDIRLIWSII